MRLPSAQPVYPSPITCIPTNIVGESLATASQTTPGAPISRSATRRVPTPAQPRVFFSENFWSAQAQYPQPRLESSQQNPVPKPHGITRKSLQPPEKPLECSPDPKNPWSTPNLGVSAENPWSANRRKTPSYPEFLTNPKAIRLTNRGVGIGPRWGACKGANSRAFLRMAMWHLVQASLVEIPLRDEESKFSAMRGCCVATTVRNF